MLLTAFAFLLVVVEGKVYVIYVVRIRIIRLFKDQILVTFALHVKEKIKLHQLVNENHK